MRATGKGKQYDWIPVKPIGADIFKKGWDLIKNYVLLFCINRKSIVFNVNFEFLNGTVLISPAKVFNLEIN